MKQYKTPQIVTLVEAFDYKDCAFIILEKMQDSVTVLSQSENFPLCEPSIRYILH